MVERPQIAYKAESESGGGQEMPMLEQRVAQPETTVARFGAVLERLEPKIVEIALTGAKQADIQKLQQDLSQVKGSVAALEGRFAGLEGRFSGLDARLGSLPTIWSILTIVFTTWAIGSGIVFTIAKLAK
jgi:hypothetical protein